jgi:hypothetical protein
MRLGLIGALAACLVTGITLARELGDNTTADRLVEAARLAELEGDTARHFALLRQAVRIAPDYKPARWQLGQVLVDGEWLPIEEAQRRAAADPRQAQYRDQRQLLGVSAEGQLALARWCRKKDLHDEAQFHWASVLAVEPNHEEALRAVDRRWHNGRLLTAEEIAQQKEQLRQSKQAAKRWSPSVARWMRDVAGGDPGRRDAALEEIRLLRTVEIIPALEEVTLGRDAARERTADECRQIALAFLEALGEMPDQAATESLVRHAVLAPATDVRELAIKHLKPRPHHDYIPLLLSGLAMPIESSFEIITGPDGSVHYTHSFYREGADADWSADARHSSMQHVFRGRNFEYERQTGRVFDRTPHAQRGARIAAVARTSNARYARAAAALESETFHVNQASEAINARIIPALVETTGQRFEKPTDWWQWWRDNNEYYAKEHPVEHNYYSDTQNYVYGRPWDTIAFRENLQMSCFAKGTPIWTKTGQRPVESLELGDLVLAQDVNTGELAYQPVVGRTVRPPCGILKISFGVEKLRTTPGHPFWVAGVGWRMAKELGDGAILHGVTGSPRVESTAADGEEEAYNLVVAEFNTYFVGESGLLVHDNTPRRPTRATVPGLAAQ